MKHYFGLLVILALCGLLLAYPDDEEAKSASAAASAEKNAKHGETAKGENEPKKAKEQEKFDFPFRRVMERGEEIPQEIMKTVAGVGTGFMDGFNRGLNGGKSGGKSEGY